MNNYYIFYFINNLFHHTHMNGCRIDAVLTLCKSFSKTTI